MQVTVSVDGVEHSISPTAGDLVRLEREYKISAAQLDDSSISVEYVLFLAWTALKRTGVVEVDFDTFLDLCDVPRTEPLDPPPPLPLT